MDSRLTHSGAPRVSVVGSTSGKGGGGGGGGDGGGVCGACSGDPSWGASCKWVMLSLSLLRVILLRSETRLAAIARRGLQPSPTLRTPDTARLGFVDGSVAPLLSGAAPTVLGSLRSSLPVEYQGRVHPNIKRKAIVVVEASTDSHRGVISELQGEVDAGVWTTRAGRYDDRNRVTSGDGGA